MLLLCTAVHPVRGWVLQSLLPPPVTGSLARANCGLEGAEGAFDSSQLSVFGKLSKVEWQACIHLTGSYLSSIYYVAGTVVTLRREGWTRTVRSSSTPLVGGSGGRWGRGTHDVACNAAPPGQGSGASSSSLGLGGHSKRKQWFSVDLKEERSPVMYGVGWWRCAECKESWRWDLQAEWREACPMACGL